MRNTGTTLRDRCQLVHCTLRLLQKMAHDIDGSMPVTGHGLDILNLRLSSSKTHRYQQLPLPGHSCRSHKLSVTVDALQVVHACPVNHLSFGASCTPTACLLAVQHSSTALRASGKAVLTTDP